jgi:Putative auto-transporter adhesin, head GIN domain
MALLGKRMGHAIFPLLLLLLPQSASAAEHTFLMGGFDDIIVEGDMTVNIVTGKSPSAKASGDQRVLDSVRINRQGTTVTVRLQEILNNNKGTPILLPLIINMTNRNVRNITLRGNARVTVDSVTGYANTNILIIGSGELSVANMMVDQLGVIVSGNAKMAIAGGSAKITRVNMDGSGTFSAPALQTRNLQLTHNGNATTTAMVSEKAEIFNTGAGTIAITGPGRCFIRKASSAKITCSNTAKPGSN